MLTGVRKQRARKAVARLVGIVWLSVSGLPVVASDFGDVSANNCTSMRIPGKCQPAPLSPESMQKERSILGTDLEIKKTLVLPPQQFPGAANLCLVSYSMSYDQRNDSIRATTTVANPTCGKSHGEFEIRIRTMGEQAQPVTRSLIERWSRSDDKDLKIDGNYPMAGATDLVWVRVRSKQRTACVCD